MNNTVSEPASITSFRQWMENLPKGYSSNHTVNTHSEREVLQMLDAATKACEWLRKRGFNCFQRGSGAINKTGFAFTAQKDGNKITFKVLGPGAPMSYKGVTETSREAYRSINLDTLQREVVRAALECGETYDRDLAERIGKGPNDVSARRNELELADFEYNGKMYRIEYHKQKPSKHTNRRVQWWRVVEAVNGQTSLF